MKYLIIFFLCFPFSVSAQFQVYDTIPNHEFNYYHLLVNQIDTIYNLEKCSCQKDTTKVYFYHFNPMSVRDSMGNMYHQVIIYQKTSRNYYSMMKYQKGRVRTIQPREGFKRFEAKIQNLNIKIIPDHYFKIANTVLSGPDASSVFVQQCKNGKVINYYWNLSVEGVTRYGDDENKIQIANQQRQNMQSFIRYFLNIE